MPVGAYRLRADQGENMTTLYIVVPCYNEEEVLSKTAATLLKKFEQLTKDGKITSESRIVFIDDGSTDSTWQKICSYTKINTAFGGIKLSRNRGHQNALLCGLLTLKEYADALISIDADLQDDINAIDSMLDSFEQGSDIVYGVRSERKTDTFFKRFTAEAYYKILDKMGAKVIFNHADFRLMSKRAVECLALFKERNIFLRGLVPMIGFKTDIVKYKRSEREAGESKYPLSKMLALAWEGITSLSIRPIRLVTTTGALIFGFSILMLIYSVVRFFMGATVSGWASLAVSIWAIGGLQLLAIGIVGEYIGKIYLETKNRPRFIVEDIILDLTDRDDKNNE